MKVAKISLLFVALYATVLASYHRVQPASKSAKIEKNWHKIVRQESIIDFSKYADKLNEGHHSPNRFFGAKEFIQSVHGKKSSFLLKENVNNIDELLRQSAKRPLSLNEIAEGNEYEAVATYDLHQDVQYHSLDLSETLLKIRKITEASITFCGVDDIRVGDFFVGTKEGSWFTSPSSSWSKYSFPGSGVAFRRRVLHVAHSQSDKHCKHLTTEPVFVEQLFSHFRLETQSSLPVARHYRQENLGYANQGYDTPDNPAYACDDKTIFRYGDDYKGIHEGSEDDYQIRCNDYCVVSACMSLNQNLEEYVGANFDFNFCPSTNEPCQASVTLSDGVTCENCYAYLGVQMLLIFEYWDQANEGQNYQFLGKWAFEAKLNGGVGFNIDMQLTNPTVSSSSDTITIVPSQTQDSGETTVVSLGYGISLSTWTGGLTATLSGTGSATGSASCGMGASAEAYIGVAFESYAPGDYAWTFPNDASFSATQPYLSGSLTPSSFSVTVDLTATQNFAVGYVSTDGFDWLAADFDVQLSGNVEFTMDVSSAVEAENPSLSVTVNQDVVHVGEDLQLNVNIANFNPNEETFLFISFYREDYPDSSNGVPILQTKFVVPATGSAEVSLMWHVPWDNRFASIFSSSSSPQSSAMPLTSRIGVRASNRVLEVVFSPTFQVIADEMIDGIISPLSPVAPGADVELEFNPRDLSLYVARRGSFGHGSIMTIQDLALDLVEEIVERTTGVVALTNTTTLAVFELQSAATVQDDGSMMIQAHIPQRFLAFDEEAQESRFFFLLRSVKLPNLRGFSAGYFTMPTMNAAAERSNVGVLMREPVNAGIGGQKRSLLLGETDTMMKSSKAEIKVVEEIVDEADMVSSEVDSSSLSCSGDYITYWVSFAGGFNSIKVCNIPIGVGLSTGSITLVKPTCTPVTAPAVPTEHPSERPSAYPTMHPSERPTEKPSMNPTKPTPSPTDKVGAVETVNSVSFSRRSADPSSFVRKEAISSAIDDDEEDGESYYARLVIHGDDVVDNTVTVKGNSANTQSSQQNHWSHSNWFIATMVISVFVLLVTMAAFLVVYNRRNKSTAMPQSDDDQEEEAKKVGVDLEASFEHLTEPTLNPLTEGEIAMTMEQ